MSAETLYKQCLGGILHRTPGLIGIVFCDRDGVPLTKAFLEPRTTRRFLKPTFLSSFAQSLETAGKMEYLGAARCVSATYDQYQVVCQDMGRDNDGPVFVVLIATPDAKLGLVQSLCNDTDLVIIAGQLSKLVGLPIPPGDTTGSPFGTEMHYANAVVVGISRLHVRLDHLSATMKPFGTFRSSIWDPGLIIGQMLALQCLFYTSLTILVLLFDSLASQLPVHLDHVFRPLNLAPRDTATRLSLLACLVNSLLLAPCVCFVVGRARLCLDFVSTVHAWHVFFTWVMFAFPTSPSWWLLQVCCVVLSTVLAENLCLRREMQEIPVRIGGFPKHRWAIVMDSWSSL